MLAKLRLAEGAAAFGSQCVVLGMDVKRVAPRPEIPSGYELILGGYSVRALAPVAAASLAAFIRRERRVAAPIVALGVFRAPGFAAITLGSVLVNLASFAVLIFVPFLVLDLLVGLLGSLTTLAAFLAMLWALSDQAAFSLHGRRVVVHGYLVWAAIIYSLFGTVLVAWVGQPCKQIGSLHRLMQIVSSMTARLFSIFMA